MLYLDDNEQDKKAWIGCDSCWRWFHYKCAGYKLVVPST